MDRLAHNIFLQDRMEEKLEVGLIVEKVKKDLDEETEGYHDLLDSVQPIKEYITHLDPPKTPHGEGAIPPNLELKHHTIEYILKQPLIEVSMCFFLLPTVYFVV